MALSEGFVCLVPEGALRSGFGDKGVMRTGFDQMIKACAVVGERRMKSIKTTLKSERSELDAADYALVNGCIQRLPQVQKRVKKLIPLMDALLK